MDKEHFLSLELKLANSASVKCRHGKIGGSGGGGKSEELGSGKLGSGGVGVNEVMVREVGVW